MVLHDEVMSGRESGARHEHGQRESDKMCGTSDGFKVGVGLHI